jgi:hypothetical protein
MSKDTKDTKDIYKTKEKEYNKIIFALSAYDLNTMSELKRFMVELNLYRTTEMEFKGEIPLQMLGKRFVYVLSNTNGKTNVVLKNL